VSDDRDFYNPDGIPLEELWKYDPAKSPRRTPTPRPMRAGDLLSVQMAGDPGNAERLERMFGHALRYCTERRKWLVFLDGAPCWAWDDDGGIALACAASVIHEVYRQGRFLADAAAEKEALRTLFLKRLRDMLVLAQDRLKISVRALDSHPDLLVCRNGTVDLCTAELRPSRREHFSTKSISIDFDLDAPAPVFHAFLKEAVGDQVKVALQQYVGYSLSGRTSAKAVFMPLGPSDTGKSTFLRTIYNLLGDYAAQIQIESLMKGSEHSGNAFADLAALRGARFVMTSEVDAGHRLNVSRLKSICQGSDGEIRAILKYENQMQFVETHKLWIDSNFRPIVPHDDGAVFNRIIPIPFERVIPRDRMDHALPDKLRAEFPGILAWGVLGSTRVYRNGGDLPRPSAITTAVSAYRGAMDIVARFLDDCCERDAMAETGSSLLYRGFEHWCGQQRISPLSHKKFSQTLVGHGFKITERRDGNVFEGIRLA
jgi:putative DNA primase/helicase